MCFTQFAEFSCSHEIIRSCTSFNFSVSVRSRGYILSCLAIIVALQKSNKRFRVLTNHLIGLLLQRGPNVVVAIGYLRVIGR